MGMRQSDAIAIQKIEVTPTTLVLSGTTLLEKVALFTLDQDGGHVSRLTYDPPEGVRVLSATSGRLILGAGTSHGPPQEALGYDLRSDSTFRPISLGRTDLTILRLEESEGSVYGCGSTGEDTVVFRLREGELEHEIDEVALLPGGRCVDLLVDADGLHVLFGDPGGSLVRVRSIDSVGRELARLPREFSAPWVPDGVGAMARRTDGGLVFAYGDRASARLVMYAP